jgi:HlyD family secretion protein
MPEDNITAVNIEPVQLLSTEVQEIISYRPHWIVRNGSLLFLLIIAGLITVTFFISYPDIVTASATFTSINAPKEIKVKTEGRLVMLAVSEGKTVTANEIIGYIESRASHEAVIQISSATDSMELLMQRGKLTESVALLDSIVLVESKILPETIQSLGELQQAYQVFMQSFYLFKQYLSKGFYITKRKMLQGDISFLQQQQLILQEQKKLQQEDLGLAKATIDANSTLQEQEVISPLDYRNEKSKFISKQLSIPQINAAIISNESNQHEKQKEIAQLDNDIAQQKNIFLQALHTFKTQADEWKNKYLLISPIAGNISFAGFIQKNQQLKAGQTLCYVNSGNAVYFSEITIPQINFGKVKQGQQVILKLAAYPYQEFGLIKGILAQISSMPTDSGYVAKVALPAGFTSTYKKQLLYKEGLKATGEIITDNKKLSERLLYQFVSLIKNR